MSMWEPFSESARSTMVLAQQEAQRLGNNFIGTEHILLGILAEGESGAAVILASLGVDVTKARAEVEALARTDRQTTPQEMVFTPRAKRVVELAFEEARRLNHNYIGTEHLLLAIMREADGFGARALAKLGVDPAAVRAAVNARLPRAAETPAAKAPPHRTASKSTLWEPFTEHARYVMVLAQEEAQRHGNNYIGTAHMLAGILLQPESLAATVLERHGVNLAAVRDVLLTENGNQTAEEMVFTLGAKRAMELAFEFANELNHQYIGSEHLALGIIREDADTKGRILARLGCDSDELSRAIREAAATKQRDTGPDARG